MNAFTIVNDDEVVPTPSKETPKPADADSDTDNSDAPAKGISAHFNPGHDTLTVTGDTPAEAMSSGFRCKTALSWSTGWLRRSSSRTSKLAIRAM